MIAGVSIGKILIVIGLLMKSFRVVVIQGELDAIMLEIRSLSINNRYLDICSLLIEMCCLNIDSSR